MRKFVEDRERYNRQQSQLVRRGRKHANINVGAYSAQTLSLFSRSPCRPSWPRRIRPWRGGGRRETLWSQRWRSSCRSFSPARRRRTNSSSSSGRITQSRHKRSVRHKDSRGRDSSCQDWLSFYNKEAQHEKTHREMFHEVKEGAFRQRVLMFAGRCDVIGQGETSSALFQCLLTFLDSSGERRERRDEQRL